MKIVWLNKKSDELEIAFNKLPDSDPVAECECCGEVWGYMETEDTDDGIGWRHTFRHRHFGGKERKYVHIPATPGWEPKSFECRRHLGLS